MGPASSMSLTSKGYYVRLEDTGNYIFSTAVIVPKPKSAEAFQQVQEEVQNPQQGACPELDAIEAEMFPPDQPPQQALQIDLCDQPDGQVQQQLEALQPDDAEYSPSEMGEPEKETFSVPVMAELGEEFHRPHPDEVPAEGQLNDGVFGESNQCLLDFRS